MLHFKENVMERDVWVAGVGMIPLTTPGASPSHDAHPDQAEVQLLYASQVYGDSCSGQRAAYAIGMSGCR